jgi:hypothetical protein
MEAHLRAIALWHKISAVFALAMFVLVAIVTLVAGDHNLPGPGGVAGRGLVVLFCIVAAALLAGFYAVAHFLGKYVNAARLIGAGLAVLFAVPAAGHLLAVPIVLVDVGARGYGGPESLSKLFAALINTAYYGPCLWALLSRRSKRICSPEYVRVFHQVPSAQPATFSSPFFWAPLLISGIGLLICVCMLLR